VVTGKKIAKFLFLPFPFYFLSSKTMNRWNFFHHFMLFGCRAADWNLNEPTWNGRMRMVTSGAQLNIKLEDKMSGQLFANCPVEAYPGLFH
jgi:Protein of unknown function (DUF1681)